jgi:hypothetical protein
MITDVSEEPAASITVVITHETATYIFTVVKTIQLNKFEDLTLTMHLPYHNQRAWVIWN